MQLVENHTVRITAIGNGYGETILINISDKFYIGIDSCKCLSKVDKNQNKSNLEKFLEEFDEKKQLFWIITHYHYDHYQDFTNTYSKLPSGVKIIHPGEYLAIDYVDLIKQHTFNKTKSVLVEKQSLNEFEKMRKLVTDLKFQAVSFGNGMQQILSTPVSDSNKRVKDLSVDVFAPLKKESDSIRSKELFRTIKSPYNIKSAGELINSTSYITRIKYGTFEGIFFGDATLDRLKVFFKNTEPLNSDFIKISHHGSSTGTDKEIIENIKSSKNQIAFTTPYSNSKLPEKNVIDLYIDNNIPVKISKTSKIDEEFITKTGNKLNGPKIEFIVKTCININDYTISAHFNTSTI